MRYNPKHLRQEEAVKTEHIGVDEHHDGAPERVHPLGIPTPDQYDGSEFVPFPGTSVPIPGTDIAPNGAVIRNPWSQKSEVEPDHEYTPEQEDLNLLIM